LEPRLLRRGKGGASREKSVYVVGSNSIQQAADSRFAVGRILGVSVDVFSGSSMVGME
jgi:hypothetical protein